MPPAILPFSDTIIQSSGRRHLLLGNGFSIALRPNIFSYRSLLDSADFSRAPHLKAIFDALGTTDFEVVIHALVQSARLLRVYGAPETLISAVVEGAEVLKEILVQAIAGNHPDRPANVSDEAFRTCRNFLRHFERIFTLNYDLLLYWALMHEEDDEPIRCDDGFRNPETQDEAGYVAWLEHQSANIYFLHGALHLFDAGTELQKYTWTRTAVPLMDQIRAALDRGYFPLFVAEGSSSSKVIKINHNAYLHKALRSFENITGSLYVFGHSLGDSDDHILKIIENGKVSRLFVSIYGDPNGDEAKRAIDRANRIARARGDGRRLTVSFFDAHSAHVWE